MHCAIYKCRKQNTTYLYIERIGDFSRLPAQLLQYLGPLEFVMELELHPARRLAHADTLQVRALLQSQGYYLQLPPAVDRVMQ